MRTREKVFPHRIANEHPLAMSMDFNGRVDGILKLIYNMVPDNALYLQALLYRYPVHTVDGLDEMLEWACKFPAYGRHELMMNEERSKIKWSDAPFVRTETDGDGRTDLNRVLSSVFTVGGTFDDVNYNPPGKKIALLEFKHNGTMVQIEAYDMFTLRFHGNSTKLRYFLAALVNAGRPAPAEGSGRTPYLIFEESTEQWCLGCLDVRINYLYNTLEVLEEINTVLTSESTTTEEPQRSFAPLNFDNVTGMYVDSNEKLIFDWNNKEWYVISKEGKIQLDVWNTLDVWGTGAADALALMLNENNANLVKTTDCTGTCQRLEASDPGMAAHIVVELKKKAEQLSTVTVNDKNMMLRLKNDVVMFRHIDADVVTDYEVKEMMNSKKIKLINKDKNQTMINLIRSSDNNAATALAQMLSSDKVYELQILQHKYQQVYKLC